MEKQGIPTVSIGSSAYYPLVITTLEAQGLAEDDMAWVVIPHPIGGLSEEEVHAKVDAAFPEILKAATEWQPSG